MINKIAFLLIILLLAACGDSDSDKEKQLNLQALCGNILKVCKCKQIIVIIVMVNPGPPDYHKELFLKNFINKKHPSSLNWGNIALLYKPGNHKLFYHDCFVCIRCGVLGGKIYQALQLHLIFI